MEQTTGKPITPVREDQGNIEPVDSSRQSAKKPHALRKRVTAKGHWLFCMEELWMYMQTLCNNIMVNNEVKSMYLESSSPAVTLTVHESSVKT